MRQYLRYTILFSVISFASHAASTGTYPTNPTAVSAPKKTSGFAVPTVLSPQEFTSKVDSINKQTDDRISQEVASTIPKPVTPNTTTVSQPATPTVTTQPQTQQPVYSGFGGGAPAATTQQPAKPTKPAAPQGGGWQIQY